MAGVYSGITHYLKAVAATGTVDTATVMAKMKATTPAAQADIALEQSDCPLLKK